MAENLHYLSDPLPSVNVGMSVLKISHSALNLLPAQQFDFLAACPSYLCFFFVR